MFSAVAFVRNRRIPAHMHARIDSISGESRAFSVKELPWCAPHGSPNRSTPGTSNNHVMPLEKQKVPDLVPIKRFGIIAAMSRNGVIGINGRIPWHLPDDRRLFEKLTKGKTLIIGRRTYEEKPDHSHISHARNCIVVSTTLTPESLGSENNIKFARSFPEALSLANLLAAEKSENLAQHENDSDTDDEITCWVGGGEAIYLEALKHTAAEQVHLTVIELNLEASSSSAAGSQVAYFPSKYRWDHMYEEVSRHVYPSTTNGSCDNGNQYDFTYFIYKRRRR